MICFPRERERELEMSNCLRGLLEENDISEQSMKIELAFLEHQARSSALGVDVKCLPTPGRPDK